MKGLCEVKVTTKDGKKNQKHTSKEEYMNKDYIIWKGGKWLNRCRSFCWFIVDTHNILKESVEYFEIAQSCK